MRNSNIKAITYICLAALLFMGCGLGKMVKKYPDVKYTVTPDVLEVHGGKVPVTISGSIPPKYFHKKATVTFTPTLKFEGGEAAMKSTTLLGEAAEGEGQKIGYTTGGSFSYVDTIAYKDAMRKSELMAVVGAVMGSKTAEFDDRKLADGCIITSTRVANAEDVMLGADKYEKITILNQKAELYYPIQSSVIPSKEMRSESVKALKGFIKNKYVTKDVRITAWASPDGPEDLNDKISNDRTNSAFRYIKNELRRMKLEGAKNDSLYTKVSKGEYWDGFNQLVGASDIEDKQLILDIVNRHSDVIKREQEIKNLAVVFLTLAKDILPRLRKAEISINSYEPKKTDAEIDSLATAKPDTLDVEELLYAATLTEDGDKQMAIYTSATTAYPEDWRGYNNVAYLHLKKGDMEDAKAWLAKANEKGGSAEVTNNEGVIAVWNMEYDKGKTLFEDAKSKGGDESNNLGILHLRIGDYPTALEYFSSTCSYNSALTNLVAKDNDKAKAQCECAEQNAATLYLKAIVGARTGDTAMMKDNLKKAVSADGSYRKEAMTDLEFAKYWESTDFKGAVQ